LFEQLEARHLLATFMVTNLNDSGAGSLRQAIIDANNFFGADMIEFQAGLTGIIELSTGEIELTETLVINGPGADQLTIDAQGQSRVFDIGASEGDFTLAGLIITGGKTTQDNSGVNSETTHSGGAIRSITTGVLTIQNSRLAGNLTEGELATGGALFAVGDVAFTDSVASHNLTLGNGASGGAVFALGEVIINDSEVFQNRTLGDNAKGGGIVGGRVLIANSTLSGNTTKGTGSSAGAVMADGSITLSTSMVDQNLTQGDQAPGGGLFSAQDVSLVDSIISDNRSDGDRSSGGGVHAEGEVTVTESLVSGNRTLGELAPGGGIFSSQAVTLTNSVVSSNSTDGTFSFGGGVDAVAGVTLTSSTVADNRTNGVGASGGGIFTTLAAVLTNSTVSDNETTGGSADGGGIAAYTGASLTQSTLSQNFASGEGGGLYVSVGDVTLASSTVTRNEANTAGGGVRCQDGTIRSQNSIVSANSTGGTNPDLYPVDTELVVQHSIIGNNDGTSLPESQTANASGSLVGTANDPIDAKLGVLRKNGGPTKTHALLPSSPAIDAGDNALLVDESGNAFTSDQRGEPFTRVENSVTDIGAYESQSFDAAFLLVTTAADELDFDNAVRSLREAVELANGTPGADTVMFDAETFASAQTVELLLGEIRITESLTISGPGRDLLTIDGRQESRIFNITETEGDYTISGLTLTSGRTVTDNDTINHTLQHRQDGGAIRSMTDRTLELRDMTVRGSSTEGRIVSGGGVYSRGVLKVTNSTITGNHTGGVVSDGGGVRGRSVILSNSTISENHTRGQFGDGGGVTATDLVASNATITGNSTRMGGRGGGISAGSVTLIDSTVSKNTTMGKFGQGGGIRGSKIVTAINSTISGNITLDESATGAGIYGDDETEIILINSTVTQNIVEDTESKGGGIWNTDSTTLIHNSIVANNRAAGGSPDIRPGSGQLLLRYSLLGDNSGTSLFEAQAADGDGNLIGTSENPIDPRLGPLQDNGGSTQTHAPVPGSPVIDAGNNTHAVDPGPDGLLGTADDTPLQFDQRDTGFPRILDDDNDNIPTVDMGAIESVLAFDFGDAPSAYPVTVGQNGARHIVGDLILGRFIDAEADGQPHPAAGGDNSNGGADEDGVQPVSSLVASAVATTTSSFVISASQAGFLDAWIDFDHNGDWSDAGEQIFDSVAVQAGPNVLNFQIPAGATPGVTGVRFRLSSVGGLAPTGVAVDGEVEDYMAMILDGDAVDGVRVEVGPSDEFDVVTEGDEVVVRSGEFELFRSPGATLNQLDINALVPGDAKVNVANLDTVFNGIVGAQAGFGNDTLRLTGAGQSLDLTQIADPDIHGFETIDITGSGDNTLTLDVFEVLNIVLNHPSASDALTLKSNAGDVINIGSGWEFSGAEDANGDFVRIVTQGNATLRSVGPFDWTNPIDPLDVDADGFISPTDVVNVINEVNNPKFSVSARLSPADATSFPNRFFDAFPDGFVVALDVLTIINHINSNGTTAVPEGESTPGAVDLAFAKLPWIPSVRSRQINQAPSDESASVPDIAQPISSEYATDHAFRQQTPSSRKAAESSHAEDDQLLDAIDAFFGDLDGENRTMT
jgi:hypothetical protein